MAQSNSGATTRTSPSVSAIREQYKQDLERTKINYDKANDDRLIKLRDPNRNSSVTLNAFDRERIRSYLQAPGSNEENLRNAVRYLSYRSQVLYRILHWYSSMWCLNARQIIPDYSLTKDNDPSKMLKQYENTLKQLEIYDIQGNWRDVAYRCYLEDVCYAVWFRDDKDAFFYILDPSECRIDGRYYTGDFSYSVDMSKWRSTQRRELAEWLGEPFVSMLREYDNNNVRWIHMPDEYAACFKFNSDRSDLVIVPFSPLLQSFAGLNDLADLQAIKDEQSIYKLLLLPMKILSSAKVADEFEISPDLLLKYYDKLLDILPDYVAAAPIPGELTNDNVVDFATTSADKDVDRLEQSQTTIMSTSGGGAVLNASHITSSVAFSAWLKAESEFATSSLLPQIEGFTNRMLGYDVSGTPCKVKYFEVTVYTKDDLKESLLQSCQHSFSNRLAYNTLNDISERTTLAMEFLETNVLNLPGIMNHPLQASYNTTSDSGEVGQGRDRLPDDEIADSTERSRNE